MTHELVVVELECLRLPADGPTLQERMGAPHVGELARSLQDPDVGPLAPPVVDAATMEVLDGGDRVAAHHVAGNTHIEVSLRRPSKAGRQKLLLAGNAYRRHEPERQARELRRLYELHLAEEVAREQEGRMAAHLQAIGRGPGRPSTPEGRAVRQTAKALGKRPEAVRKALERQGKRRRQKLGKIPVYDGDLLELEFLDATYTVDTLGLQLPEDREVEVAILKRHLWHAQLMLARSAGSLKKAIDAGYGLAEHHARALLTDAEHLRMRLELLAPAVLCLPCEGKGCDECRQLGWLDGIGG